MRKKKIEIIYCCMYCGTKIHKQTALRGKGCCRKCAKQHHIKPIGKEILIDLYWNKKVSVSKISKMFNCCSKTIYNYMLDYNILTRSYTEAQLLSLHNKGKNNGMYGVSLSMDKHNNWKNGTRKCDYIERKVPFHPFANKAQYVVEHRLVIEAYLNKVSLNKWIKYGREDNYPKNAVFLPKSNIVHHIDENKHNNKRSNLIVCFDNAEHNKLHKYAYMYLIKIGKIRQYINYFKREMSRK